jgi:Transglycosylase SLT domain
MSTLRIFADAVRSAVKATFHSMRVFAGDVGRGLLVVSHNTLALLGLFLVVAVLFATGREDVRVLAEQEFLEWLQSRQVARSEPSAAVEPEISEPTAIARATAVDPRELDGHQSAVAHWLSRRYRVAPEPISRLVQEAWVIGQHVKLDPTLILAIMAVESSFNPFAQSSVGAQGLMQVMTKVHDEKYERFGGTFAAFDPVTNLRVGVQVLKECIARAGSVEAGLRFYVGAANLADDGGYVSKVLAEQNSLRLVMSGKSVPPLSTTIQVASVAPSLVAQERVQPTVEMSPATPPESEAHDTPPRLN